MKRNIKLIDDFVDGEGNFISFEAFSGRYPDFKINYVVYMGWKKAIPCRWRRMVMASQSLTPGEREKEIEIRINMKKLLLVSIHVAHRRSMD